MSAPAYDTNTSHSDGCIEQPDSPEYADVRYVVVVAGYRRGSGGRGPDLENCREGCSLPTFHVCILGTNGGRKWPRDNILFVFMLHGFFVLNVPQL